MPGSNVLCKFQISLFCKKEGPMTTAQVNVAHAERVKAQWERRKKYLDSLKNDPHKVLYREFVRIGLIDLNGNVLEAR